jgi:hypothetical protein
MKYRQRLKENNQQNLLLEKNLLHQKKSRETKLLVSQLF